MDMIERVARAICNGDPDMPTIANWRTVLGETGERATADDPPVLRWQVFEGKARAAIAAMREPTEAMIEAGIAASHGDDAHMRLGDSYGARMGALYAAAIDAALKD